MRPNLDAKVRHGGFAPSLWATHCPRDEAAARVPRVKALEAVFAKSAASSILSRKHSNVLFDNVAFHRERLAGVAQTKRLSPQIRTREFKLVQLKGREHAHPPHEMAHYLKLSGHAAVRCSNLCRRYSSFRCRKLCSERLKDRHISRKKQPDVGPNERGVPVALHADVVLFEVFLTML
jgi:hypothetical protein